MPSYLFRCPSCSRETTRFKSVAKRNENPPHCVCHRQPVVMTRKPAAPAFVVNGYSAKNGYSNDSK